MPGKLYVGIDNGSTGGIAVLLENGAVWRVEAMPRTEVDLLTLLSIVGQGSPCGAFAVLEHAQAFPKMGVSSAFNYGKGYGAMIMALTSAEIPFDIVVPRKWQAALSCLSGGDKNVTKRRAQQLFPSTTVTHAIADALLMAEYCRRLRVGDPQSERSTDGKEESRAQQPSEARHQGGRRSGKTEALLEETRRREGRSPARDEGRAAPARAARTRTGS